MRITLLAGLVLLCACSMPAGPPPPAPVPVPAAAPPDETMEAVARALLAEVNRARADNGVDALRGAAALDDAARGHSQELAARRTLDHTSTHPARRSLTMRIEAAGGSWNLAAENLASTSGAASAVAALAVQQWLGSPGHRRNMLEAAFTHTGVGVAIDQRGIWYVTQVYVLPSGVR